MIINGIKIPREPGEPGQVLTMGDDGQSRWEFINKLIGK